MTQNSPTDFSSVESRRSTASRREMSRLRRLYYFVGMPVLRAIMRVLTWTYRPLPVIGEHHMRAFIDSGEVCAPCYWHQAHVLCSHKVRDWIDDGFKACFLISGSVDGDVPERIARAWGAEAIRGSANQSGALALRDMQGMMKRGYSIVTTADGPRGPQYEFKAGAVLMARIAGVPIVPMACAADRAWYLDRWDRFMIPKPFARVVVGVGTPYAVPRDVPLDEIEPHRENVQAAVRSLMEQCEQAVKRA
ncbi:MAG: lysophospholipid acyltransferase family protein [Woeseiaceae bacterium]|nr:lysophospholipid acyltransferase family protein [Woeseiaceae bacterium]